MKLSKSALLGVSLLAISNAPLLAQESELDGAQRAKVSASDAAENSADIVVTGSRVARGYDMPTPVTIIGESELNSSASSNLASFVQDLPGVSGSTSRATGSAQISSGSAGINAIDLRGLGPNRTLVLLDGRRSVGSTVNGTVDINTFPQGLVKAVEIVTGGASAAYGSDAVSGVANFILDKKFSGLKGSLENGITTYGDDHRWRINLSAGTSFAGGRGHVLLNGELAQGDGIYGVPRDWNRRGWYLVFNPAYRVGNGEPEYLVSDNTGPQLMTPGGIITSTSSAAATAALRGTYFGQGGATSRLNYGASLSPSSPDMIGGDWRITNTAGSQSLLPGERRKGLFGRLSYEIFDNVEMFGEASYNRDASVSWGGAQRNEGGVSIRIDNAFLPEAVRQTAIANGVNPVAGTLTIGTSNADLGAEVGNRVTDNHRTVQRYVLGLEGQSGLLGLEWKWDASVQRGITKAHQEVGSTNVQRLAMAQDAVFAPAGNAAGIPTGRIVCRSTLTDPANGCVPFNRLGVGVNSQEAVDYVMGFPFRDERFQQDVAAANFSTDIANPWIAPIAVAFGVEHRVEKVSGDVPAEFREGWFTGNYLPTFGKYDVTEGYLEALMTPLSGVNLNGAVRFTNYSTSGGVTTWKLGATFQPIDDVKFRITRSRDIRAPNLSELFQAGSRRTNTLLDPFAGNIQVQFLENTTGNLNLSPEVANSLSFGVVIQPSFVPKFALSIDYYRIDIEDAIGTVSFGDIVDGCFSGRQNFCDALTRRPNADGVLVISEVANQPFNFASVKARGIDIEATYQLSMSDLASGWTGNLSLRAMATHYLKQITDNGFNPPVEQAGLNSGRERPGTPSWLYRVSAAYTKEGLSVQLTGRGVSSGAYDNSFIECRADCPASSIFARTINNNRIAGAFYLDTYVAQKIEIRKSTVELFLSIENLLNKDPAVAPMGPGGAGHIYAISNPAVYDMIGRTFRAGIRFTL